MTRRDAFVQLILARLREFFREPVALFWVYGFPLILAVSLGLAFSRSEAPKYPVDVRSDGPADATETLRILAAHSGLVVASHPGETCRERLRLAQSALTVEVHADGPLCRFDAKRAESVQAHDRVDAALARAAAGDRAPLVRIQNVEEPGQRYIDFLLPGLVGLNLMGGGLFGLGFVLVDLRVRKLFKRLMATPVRRGDFLAAFVAARMLFLVPEMFVLLVVVRLAFGVPLLGSVGALVVVVLAGSAAFAGIGLLLGSRADKIETISGLSNLVMLPMYLLSGVFFSASRFPEWLQPLVQALPLTQLNAALRAVMLEGAGLADVAGRIAILLAFASVTFLWGLARFRWT